MWADDDFCRVSKVGYDGKCGRTVHFGVKHPGSVVVVVVVVGVVVFIYFSGWDCSQLLKLESPWLSALKVIIFFGWLKHPNMAGREIPVPEMEV